MCVMFFGLATLAMYRFTHAAAALLCIISVSAFAESGEVQRTINAAPGVNVSAGVYADIRPDCTSGRLPAIRLIKSPAHGTVTIQRGNLKVANLKQCLAFEIPALSAVYRAAENYTGPDEFVLEVIGDNSRKQVQHFRVTVSGKPTRSTPI
jgi:hypothetical protein